MKFSAFGNKFAQDSGIRELMDDLGNALALNPDMIMMGGGNPGEIPELSSVFEAELRKLLEQGNLHSVLGQYDPPRGAPKFIDSLVTSLKEHYGWDISAKNIALSNGTQSSLFMLFNLFAGPTTEGERRQVLLPMAPEYIGYADTGIEQDMFAVCKPKITKTAPHRFRYEVDFDALVIDDSVGAVCVSRPGNPTGNIISDESIKLLAERCKKANVPFIIDGAYGLPFPNLTYVPAEPYWDENTILTLSLSKIGLPGVRTGIVIAHEDVISALATMNAVISLAPSSIGPAMIGDLLASGRLMSLSNDVVRPFYESKMRLATSVLDQAFEHSEISYFIHEPDGAMFLWLWFEGLPVSSRDLYLRLKKRGVLVVDGSYFFFGAGIGDWSHAEECIRVTYSQGGDSVAAGLKLIAEEVKLIFSEYTVQSTDRVDSVKL